MKATFFGTRGSTPVAGSDKVRYGGNTTCVRVESSCLPERHWLMIDAGTGIVPLSKAFAEAGGKAVTILQTHWHHDHTQGLALSRLPYLGVPVDIHGPFEHGIGPRQVYEQLMKPPLFPVPYRLVGGNITCHDIPIANVTVIVVHPQGGVKTLTIEEFQRLTRAGRQIPFKQGKHNVAECLVVRMHRSNHPEQTISYRFEERPTGKVFVFVTDHENQDGFPASFRAHLKGADLLVMDCQYERDKYDRETAGWGHATPDYVARVAREASAKALGLTHHDPWSSDEIIDRIVATARVELASEGVTVFGCRDYQEVEVGSVGEGVAAT